MLFKNVERGAARATFRAALAVALIVNSLAFPPFAHRAHAFAIGDIPDLITDPLKLGKASQNILEAVERIQLMLNQLSNIEGTVNQDLKARIDQVKGVVDEVIAAADRGEDALKQILAQAENTVLSLERQIYIDAESLIDQVQCVAQNIASVQIQEAIANAVAELKQSNPGISLFGIRIVNLDLKQVIITDPDQAYISVRDGYLKRLDGLQPSSSAYTIVSTYANVERLAQESSCAFRDPELAAIFLSEQFKYQVLASAWQTVPVVMQADH